MERFTWTQGGRFNIARGATARVRLVDGDADLRWGLLAPWRGHGGARAPMTYAAALATVAATTFLRNARAKRRCLVVADGWYAWRKIGKRRQPYWIHAPSAAAFAGICATHADDGIASFAVLVAPAAGIVAPIDGAMPIVVDERWLADPEPAPLALDGWRAVAVSDRVDDAAHDDAACIAPLGNPAQGELF